MKLNIKSLLATGLLIASVLQSSALVATLSNPIQTPFVITTNRASVYSVTISSSSTVLFNLYDSDNTNSIAGNTNGVVGAQSNAGIWGTNVVVGPVPSFRTYTTNFVSSFTNYNGYVNYSTNVGVWSIWSTNAASTNALNAIVAGAVNANTVATYPVDAIFARGVVIAASSTNFSLILNYNNGQ